MGLEPISAASKAQPPEVEAKLTGLSTDHVANGGQVQFQFSGAAFANGSLAMSLNASGSEPLTETSVRSLAKAALLAAAAKL